MQAKVACPRLSIDTLASQIKVITQSYQQIRSWWKVHVGREKGSIVKVWAN